MNDAFDHMEFRSTLGQFATGVVIVTSVHEGSPVGLTIGAFTSVSLTPPLIAFLPAKTSTTWPQVRATGAFSVNILSETQREICRAFARTSKSKFDGVDWEMSDHGTPHLSGALAWLDCELESVFEAGDHDIAIGRVIALSRGDTDRPLVYYRGAFHEIVLNDLSSATSP